MFCYPTDELLDSGYMISTIADLLLKKRIASRQTDQQLHKFIILKKRYFG